MTDYTKGFGHINTHYFNGNKKLYKDFEKGFLSYLKKRNLYHILHCDETALGEAEFLDKNGEIFSDLVLCIDDASILLIINSMNDGRKAISILHEHYCRTKINYREYEKYGNELKFDYSSDEKVDNNEEIKKKHCCGVILKHFSSYKFNSSSTIRGRSRRSTTWRMMTKKFRATKRRMAAMETKKVKFKQHRDNDLGGNLNLSGIG